MMNIATAIVSGLRWLWIVLLLISGAQMAVWVMDRKPPFSFSTYTSTLAKPGDVVTIIAKVKRELDRECSVEFSRHLIDPSGARFDLVAGQYMSADDLRKMDALMPGEIRMKMVVPSSSDPGLAHLFTSLQYSCNWFHRVFWPIEVTMELDFIVLPP